MRFFHHRRSTIGRELRVRQAEPLGVCCAGTQSGRAFPKVAVGALAVGAIAAGALSVGAIAVGRMVVGRLLIRLARIGKLEIGTLKVGALEIAEKKNMPDAPESTVP